MTQWQRLSRQLMSTIVEEYEEEVDGVILTTTVFDDGSIVVTERPVEED